MKFTFNLPVDVEIILKGQQSENKAGIQIVEIHPVGLPIVAAAVEERAQEILEKLGYPIKKLTRWERLLRWVAR